MKELFLKVLDLNMDSCNGGSMKWTLGKKITVKRQIKICQKGIHLTLNPKSWKGNRIFIAETIKVYEFQEEGMKAVCRTATLLMELSPSLLKTYEEGCAQFLKTYEEGCAQLWKTYEEGCAQLLKTYEEGCAQLWKTYEEGCVQLWKPYEEGCVQLLKTYKEGCQKILSDIMEGKL
jgi:hypothetical protein